MIGNQYNPKVRELQSDIHCRILIDIFHRDIVLIVSDTRMELSNKFVNDSQIFSNDEVMTSCVFNANNLTIVGSIQRSLLIWSALTGELQRTMKVSIDKISSQEFLSIPHRIVILSSFSIVHRCLKGMFSSCCIFSHVGNVTNYPFVDFIYSVEFQRSSNTVIFLLIISVPHHHYRARKQFTP